MVDIQKGSLAPFDHWIHHWKQLQPYNFSSQVFLCHHRIKYLPQDQNHSIDKYQYSHTAKQPVVLNDLPNKIMFISATLVLHAIWKRQRVLVIGVNRK